jgi:very-short-patch-repair endonuclease
MKRPFNADRVMLDLAAKQHGVVSSHQLLHAGVSSSALQRRQRAGLVRRLHHGVYHIGAVEAPHAREMAAVLACRGDALISLCSAGVLWEITPRSSTADPVDVITPHSDHSRRPGIRARRIRTLRPDEATKRHRIPVTTVARTLLDLAGVLGDRELERAAAEAYARRLTTRAAVMRMLAHHTGKPGVRRLLDLVGSTKPALTRSEAEERLLDLIRRVGLPAPATNVRVCGYEVDFHWRSERLVTEVDGFAFHSSARRFESDRQRDAALTAAGMRVMRVTWRQIRDEPEKTLVRLGQALVRGSQSE